MSGLSDSPIYLRWG